MHSINFKFHRHDRGYPYPLFYTNSEKANDEQAEEELEHFAIAEVVFEKAGGHDADDNGGDAVEGGAAFGISGLTGSAEEGPEGGADHGQQGDEGGDAAFSGEVEIDIVEMAEPPVRGEGAGDVGGRVVGEFGFDHFGADAEIGVGLNDGEAGAKHGLAVGV